MSENTIENYIRSIDIQQLINQLKEEDRQIILLYYWWGYGDAEIGEILDLSQQLVNYRRKKAIKKLQKQVFRPDYGNKYNSYSDKINFW